MAIKHGFRIMHYRVKTNDGYINSLYRVLKGGDVKDGAVQFDRDELELAQKKPTFLLNHAFGNCAQAWI